MYGKEENLVLHNKYEVPITKFEATIRLRIKTKAEARLWIKELERTSAVTWRVDKTYPICGGKKTQNIYRVSSKQHISCLSINFVFIKGGISSTKSKEKENNAHYSLFL